ncbi:MAG: hypothetical protein JWP89_4378 [Schlesneria sp.]|nr:hypothetical protein [Schlesneria sp.]
MSEENGGRPAKIGEGHLAAMGRAGFKELAQALPALPTSNIRPVEEPGLFGNPTPQIVTQEMGAGNSYNDMLERHASRGQAARDSRENDR